MDGANDANDAMVATMYLHPSSALEIDTLRDLWTLDQDSHHTRLAYANSLYRSTSASDVRESLIHFDHLQQQGLYYNECLLGSALAHYSLGEYELSRSFIDELFRADASSHYKSLHQVISHRLEQDNKARSCLMREENIALGAAAAGVGILALGAALTFALSSRKK
jgi:hypothetical protein